MHGTSIIEAQCRFPQAPAEPMGPRPSGPLVVVCKQWRHALQKATNQARSRLPIADVHYFRLLQLLRGHEKDYPQARPGEDEYPTSDGDWGE